MVVFSAGGWRVAVQARWVSGSRQAPAQATGCEIEAVLGFDAVAPDVPRQYLQLRWPGGDKEFLVGSPVELISLPASSIYPLPTLLMQCNHLYGLRAIALPETSGLTSNAKTAVVLLFDPDYLARSPESCAEAHGGDTALTRGDL